MPSPIFSQYFLERLVKRDEQPADSIDFGSNRRRFARVSTRFHDFPYGSRQCGKPGWIGNLHRHRRLRAWLRHLPSALPGAIRKRMGTVPGGSVSANRTGIAAR